MTKFDPKAADEIFTAALTAPADQRDRLITERCGGNQALEARVRELVTAAGTDHDVGGHFDDVRERVWSDVIAADARDEEDLSGTSIDDWRLEQRIARGGLSTVYLANREDGQFDQLAAFKVLRRGLDTDDIVSRFRAERQILSTLSHPTITQIIDGGAMPDGRPYLVLEYVDGVPVTEYCVDNELPIKDRAKLAIYVLKALEHAHRHLVVHRDIKPSNVLVSADGNVSLLDFGIAKLLDPTTVPGGDTLTRDGVTLVTPEYASPEQLDGSAVTTSSDIFQMGRLLHEMLDGVDRIPDDLRAITHRAMRHNPENRYPTVTAMADDIGRFIDDQPVSARLDTYAYRLTTLNRRRPWLIPVLAVVAISAIGYFALVTKHNWQLEIQKARAMSELEFMQDMVASRDPYLRIDPTTGRKVTLADVLDRGVARLRAAPEFDVESRLSLLTAISTAYRSLDDNHKAVELREEILELQRTRFGERSEEVIASLQLLANQYKTIGDYATAERLYDEQLVLSQEAYTDGDPRLGVAESASGHFKFRLGHNAEAETLLLSAIEKMRREESDYTRPLVNAVVQLARVREVNEHGDAMARLEYATELAATHYGADSALVALVSTQQARMHIVLENFEVAGQLLDKALAIYVPVLGRDHGSTLAALTQRSRVYFGVGDYTAAESLQREILDHYRRKYGDKHRGVAESYANLARTLARTGQLEDASTHYGAAYRSELSVMGGASAKAAMFLQLRLSVDDCLAGSTSHAGESLAILPYHDEPDPLESIECTTAEQS